MRPARDTPSTPMTLLILYITLAAICAVRLTCSRVPMLFTGRTLLTAHLVFFGAGTVLLLARPSPSRLAVWFVLLVLTSGAFLLRQRWCISMPPGISCTTLITESTARVLLPAMSVGRAVKLHPGVHPEVVRVSPPLLRLAIMTFEPPRACGKAMVFRRLLRKRFEGMFPTLTIHV